jgi:hypothetical protein
MNPPVARCPLTLLSPPVGERVAEGRVRGGSGVQSAKSWFGEFSPYFLGAGMVLIPSWETTILSFLFFRS